MPQATLDKLRFFTDTPDLSGESFPVSVEAAVEEDAPPTSRVQIAKTGTFYHPVSGKATITSRTFDSMIRNFEAGIPTDRLPVDYDHSPETRGDTRACGWIVGLSQDGGKLYAEIEWTWGGAFSVRDREYRYVSISWTTNLIRDDKTRVGPGLYGLALTNRPFLESMAAVSLSRTYSRADLEQLAEEVEEPSDSRPRMSEFATFAKALGLSEDADEQAILAAIESADGESKVFAAGKVLTLDEAAKAQGKELFSKADADKLRSEAAAAEASKTDADRLAQDVKDLQQKDADRAFTTLYDRAIENPDGALVAPAEKDALRVIFDAKGEDGFAEYLKARTPIVNGRAQGNRGDDAELSEADKREFALEGADVDEQALQIYRKAEVKAREEKRDVAEVYIELAEAEGVTA